MTATETYTVRPPKRVSTFLAERARNEKMTIQRVIILSLKECMEMYETCAEPATLSGDGAKPFDWGQFDRDVKEYTKTWDGVTDPVEWVREIRG